MAEPLALKYRPRSFTDLVGQRSVQVMLQQMLERDSIPAAMVFDGSRGTGKTTTARIFAAAVNCETQPAPCGHCPSCKSIFDGTSLDVVEIDAASNGLVDDMRQLRQQVLYSFGGRYRVVLLDEAHSMSAAAFNALLKTLEEPPPGTVFVLLTTEPSRILGTVLSRCMTFTFRRIGVADIADRLTQICRAEQLNAEPALLALLAERADGGLRDAVMTLDQVTRAGITTEDQFRQLMGETDYAPALLGALVSGDLAKSLAVVTDALNRSGDPSTVSNALAALLIDILALRGGGQIDRQGSALEARRAIASQVDSVHAFAALRILWDLKTKVRVGDASRIALDLALVMITEIFNQTPRAATSAEPGRKLSLADMQKLSAR